tara:strand:- start:45 stop:740 length:696 start_codon:yes stop_codon:yes gene_type:complete
MRTSLSKHLDKFVLCRGWIGDWEDFGYSQTRRMTVLQTTVRQPDPELLFKEQQVISTEHHINLFIPFEDLTKYNTRFFELKEPIHFSGIVERYTRKDGSSDFGIYATKQSTLPMEIERLKKSVFDSKTFQDRDIEYLEEYALPKIRVLMEELESSRECLPTFHHTYPDLMGTLIGMGLGVEERLKQIKNIKQSRTYRRQRKTKKSFVEEVSSMKTNKPNKKVRDIRHNLGF